MAKLSKQLQYDEQKFEIAVQGLQHPTVKLFFECLKPETLACDKQTTHFDGR